MKSLRTAAFAAAIVAVCAGAVHAEPIDTSIALTMNPLTGKHEVNGGSSDRLSFAPLPLAEVIARYRGEAVRFEGLPPVTFGYHSSGDGAQSTRLSIVNATYRHTLGRGTFVGIGQTLYNQITTYAPVSGQFAYTRGAVRAPIDGSEAQFSRVTGLRFEAGQIIPLQRDRIEYWLAVNPKLHGVQYTRIPTFGFRCRNGFATTIFAPGSSSGVPAGCIQIVDTFADPENGSQIDLSARIAHRVSKFGEVIYGLRYINYTAHYDDFPGMLADRNVGFAPTIGLRARL